MFIKIELKTKKKKTKKNPPEKFPVNLKALEEAVKSSYLGLGTPYQPIPVDNFVNLDGNEFPEIPAKTKITIQLCPDTDDDCDFKLSDPKLVCGKIINVGRAFNNKNVIANNYWGKVFDTSSKHIVCAPEGTLYVSPNKKNICSITTGNKFKETFVEYSIMFSSNIEFKDGFKRRYYFILDPVLDIRSNPRS